MSYFQVLAYIYLMLSAYSGAPIIGLCTATSGRLSGGEGHLSVGGGGVCLTFGYTSFHSPRENGAINRPHLTKTAENIC